MQFIFSIEQTIIGFISGSLITFFAQRFYRKEREPCFDIASVNIIKETKSGINDLEIKYKRTNITNFTITQIYFWNDGKQSIRKEDIPSGNPIKIKIKNDYKILSYEQTADKTENNFRITSSSDRKALNLKFDFIEKDDGILVRLYHTGLSDDDIEIIGNVIDGKKIIFKDKIIRKGKVSEALRTTIKSSIWFYILLLLSFIFLLEFVFFTSTFYGDLGIIVLILILLIILILSDLKKVISTPLKYSSYSEYPVYRNMSDLLDLEGEDPIS